MAKGTVRKGTTSAGTTAKPVTPKTHGMGAAAPAKATKPGKK